MTRQDVRHQRLPGCVLRHVEPDILGACTEFGRQSLAVAIQHVGDDHGRTFAGEQPRGRGTHAAGGAGNDADLVRESCHLSFLPAISDRRKPVHEAR